MGELVRGCNLSAVIKALDLLLLDIYSACSSMQTNFEILSSSYDTRKYWTPPLENPGDSLNGEVYHLRVVNEFS